MKGGGSGTEWRVGTVCDDGWNMNDVEVVCRELGCGAAKGTPSGNLYKPLADEKQKIFILRSQLQWDGR